jgi:hypothetical protein
VQFIAGKWGLTFTTRGHSIADQRGISWSDINTCFHDLDELGIPREYVNGAYSNEGKQEWNSEREKVMLENIKAAKKAKKGEANGIVICGFERMDPLVRLLDGEQIEAGAVDYRKEDWYQPTFSGDA